MIRFPLHPSFEYLACSWDVAEHFFHVDVFVPELVDTWQECDSSVPEIARVVHEAVSHFHFYVSEPEGDITRVYVESSLPYRTSSTEVFLRFFPLSVFYPNAGVPCADAADLVFEVFALGEAIFCRGCVE